MNSQMTRSAFVNCVTITKLCMFERIVNSDHQPIQC